MSLIPVSMLLMKLDAPDFGVYMLGTVGSS